MKAAIHLWLRCISDFKCAIVECSISGGKNYFISIVISLTG